MRVKFDDALETLALLKPRLTFLTAKSASGKTYLSDALKEEGFVILELDNIVRSLGKKYAEGTSPNYSKAYNVYKNQSSNALKKDFISHIHAFIDANYNKSIIIEGAISSAELIRKIFSRKYASFTFIYLLPSSIKRYTERITERYNKDIKNRTTTLAGIETINKDKKLSTELSRLAKDAMMKSIERYEYFIKSGFEIYTILV